jgi:hypothetical protein
VGAVIADDTRTRAIEAGVRELCAWDDIAKAMVLIPSDVAAAVVDVVEPIIRADERERIFSSVRAEAMTGRTSWSVECLTDRDAECDGCLCTCHIEAEVRERLRAQVRDLPSRVEFSEHGDEQTWVRYADVCALLGGES